MDYWPAVLVNPGGWLGADESAIGRHGEQFSPKAEPDTQPFAWLAGSESGVYKAGNDCDASKLDFRRTEILGEGCADAMSTDSSLSLSATSMQFKAAGSGGTRCHPKRPVMTRGFWVAVWWGRDAINRVLRFRPHRKKPPAASSRPVRRLALKISPARRP